MVTSVLYFIFSAVLLVGVYSTTDKGKEEAVKLKRVYDESNLSPADEQTLIFKQKVVVFNKNVEGYQIKDVVTVTGIDFKFSIQKHVKTGTEVCLKLIKISKPMEDEVLDEVKISCDYETPQQPQGSAIRFEAIIFERSPTEVTFVIRDGFCLHRRYDYVDTVNDIKKEDMILTHAECDSLTGRSKEERISGKLPDAEPLLPTDIALIDQQLVVVMKGNLKKFKTTDSQSSFSVLSFVVTLANYNKDSDCVKAVTLKRSDIEETFEEVRVSCKMNGPIIIDDEDIILNFANVMYILDSNNIVFIIKNGVCLQRTYHAQVDRVHHKTDRVLSLPECYQLTRWNWEQRCTAAKLNKEPPAKSLKAPGFMWLLAMGAETEGYKESPEIVMKGTQVLNLESRDFFKGEEECIRRLIITFHGVQVERLTASCGPTKNVMVNTQGIQYWKAFSFKPEPGTDKFVGLFNVNRGGSCLKIKYDVPGGNPKKFTKTQAVTTNDLECLDLISGRSYGAHRTNLFYDQKSNPCSSLGWFGGFITKFFSSLGI